MPKDNAINEITIRKYEKPYSTDKRQLVKKICLSLGLLQPGDGRDVIVDILLVLVEEQKKKNKLDSESIRKYKLRIRLFLWTSILLFILILLSIIVVVVLTT